MGISAVAPPKSTPKVSKSIAERTSGDLRTNPNPAESDRIVIGPRSCFSLRYVMPITRTRKLKPAATFTR